MQEMQDGYGDRSRYWIMQGVYEMYKIERMGDMWSFYEVMPSYEYLIDKARHLFILRDRITSRELPGYRESIPIYERLG